MTSVRVDAMGERINRNRPLKFEFNGQTFSGFEGDTLGSALLAHNQLLISRSWKYHRPRGIVTSGIEEPSALAQIESNESLIPNAKIPEVELYEGLSAKAVNPWPTAMSRLFSINRRLTPLFPAGFYYKTFMWPAKAWMFYEKFIRRAGGLGAAPEVADNDRYVHQNTHCDVLIVGAGLAGLMAARALVNSGAQVILCELSPHLGGSAHRQLGTIDGKRTSVWVKETQALLSTDPQITVLRRTVAFGSHTDNFFTLRESRTDHLPLSQRKGFRERIWHVYAKQAILATGAHERPVVFGNNDLPGIMLSSAMADYAALYGVRVGGKIVITTTTDSAYHDAMVLQKAGASVTVMDTRIGTVLGGSATQLAVQTGVEVFQGISPITAQGSTEVTGLLVKTATGAIKTIACDALGMAGGWNPVVHLYSQAGGKVVWDKVSVSFRPSSGVRNQAMVGACNASWNLSKSLLEALLAAQEAAKAVGLPLAGSRMPLVYEPVAHKPDDFWIADVPHLVSRRHKAFVDYQNDVSAADIALAVREGFESIEHIKRYTALGFGTDQGKLGNINGMALAAKALNKPIEEVGTTTFRPNYLPISFGALAGIDSGELFDPIRTTSAHQAHRAAHAVFEDVGQWKRPWYFPQEGETMKQAVEREVIAARTGLAMMDASTLGKIEINGPDAAQLLNWMYTNAWSKLEVGRCRYGLMLDENGMVFDDGVTARLGEHQYLMTTTTGGAARVMNWMERWLQTEWPHMKVYLTSVTDHWSTFAIVGPKSRDLLNRVSEGIDTRNEAFPFMSWRAGHVFGVPARVMRISFSGELAYEINVASDMGASVWQGLMEAGEVFGITPYGTETLHVLRAEKGYIIVGQDTDGSMSPIDLGMGGMVAKTKDFLGRRSLTRSDTVRTDRKQLVGLLTQDPRRVLPEGSQLTLLASCNTMPIPMVGHVTSSYHSPTLGHSIALAVVKGGHQRMGETIYAVLPGGEHVPATVSSAVFVDPKGERQNG
jgi:sarcosine oxidase subunit alpha